jgi:anti-sigma regulatory factor (Ser/Thr protein kinase)
MSLELAAEPASVAAARHAVSAFAERCGMDDLWPVKSAVSEAVGNVVVHAYRGSGGAGRLWLAAEREDDRLRVSVRDEGTGLRERSDSPGLGWGLRLMQHAADRLVGEDGPDGGLCIDLWFALESERIH